jgi:F1F0 ATPase subunit 2
MNMNSSQIVVLSLATLAGVFIGIGFFGGLWWTVSYGLRSKRPALLFLISFFSRTAFALAGFFFVGSSHLDRFVACLLGFLGGRSLIGWFLPANAKNGKATNALDPR